MLKNGTYNFSCDKSIIIQLLTNKIKNKCSINILNININLESKREFLDLILMCDNLFIILF